MASTYRQTMDHSDSLLVGICYIKQGRSSHTVGGTCAPLLFLISYYISRCLSPQPSEVDSSCPYRSGVRIARSTVVNLKHS